MSEYEWSPSSGPDDFVEFRRTGDPVKGEFRCSGCGYGVAVYRRLPACPMCGGEEWEESAWTPLARSPEAPPRLTVPTR